MALYDLAANCDYGTLREEMIRDRLVVGIRDSGLSACLQIDADLDLKKATKAIRQREAVHQQQQTLKGTGEPSSVAALHSSRDPRRQRSVQPQFNAGSRGKQRSNPTCPRCGKDPHSRDKCPAKDATCHRCQKTGHYGAVCRSKPVAASVEADLTPVDITFLDNLASATQEHAWFTSTYPA